MEKGKRFVIATADFADDGEAAGFFKAMLGRYRPGGRVGEADAMHLRALIERHPDRTGKIGSGIAHFEVMRTEHGDPCFRLVRTDGTGTDFSCRHCIEGRANSPRHAVKKALRRAVRHDLNRLRDDVFAAGRSPRLPCAATGDLITRHEARMEYRAPGTFGSIVTAFLAERGLEHRALALVTRPGQVAPDLADEAMAEEFRAFHRRVAVLDVVRREGAGTRPQS